MHPLRYLTAIGFNFTAMDDFVAIAGAADKQKRPAKADRFQIIYICLVYAAAFTRLRRT